MICLEDAHAICVAFKLIRCIIFQAGKGGELTHDETTIISGALDLTEKVAAGNTS